MFLEFVRVFIELIFVFDDEKKIYKKYKYIIRS